MKVVVLIGIPGSGKSTFARKFFPNFVYVNQDALGDRKACIEAATAALEAGKDVVIDRCNVNKSQRKHWIDLALGYSVDDLIAVSLDVHEEECIARVVSRKEHPNLNHETSLEKIREIVYNFNKSFESPSHDEGFNVLMSVRN
jgi:atypical dual specificity phosphatase